MTMLIVVAFVYGKTNRVRANQNGGSSKVHAVVPGSTPDKIDNCQGGDSNP
jgi:hypothetical protein